MPIIPNFQRLQTTPTQTLRPLLPTLQLAQPVNDTVLVPVKGTSQVQATAQGDDKLVSILAMLAMSLDNIGARIDVLEMNQAAMVQNQAAYIGNAGTLNAYNANAGVAGIAMNDGSLYKGGPTILSDDATIPLDATKGDSFEANWDVESTNLMSGTVMTQLGASVDLALEPYTDKITMTLMVNGYPVPNVRGAQLSQFLQTLDGDRRFIVPNLRIPADVTIGVRFDIIKDLGGPTGSSANVYAWAAAEG